MKRYVAIIASSLMILCSTPGIAFAAYTGPYEEVCADNPTASVCRDKGNVSTDTASSPIYGPNGILPKVANILAIVAGIIAVVMIMYGGLTYITSQGEVKRPDGRPGKVVVAKNTIIYASVGLVIVALARIIIEFILRIVA